MKKAILFFLWLSGTHVALAQMPDGYYEAADGRCGDDLRYALEGIISAHEQRTYKDLWTDFQSTDKRADGKVWDMYSGITNYTFGTDQGKNYTGEGQTYNREHSFPNSWFNKDESSPMYTDLYHLYPTDGYVNNRRSNYPYGEVGTATYVSGNSFSKLGQATNSGGYTGKVFEPDDEYKGDLARTYFYMVTCYASKVGGWHSEMLSGDDLAPWTIELLLRWSEQDPVSEKERNRIEAVYGLQHNRNPFIDCPGLEAYIWGDMNTIPANLSALTNSIAAVQGEATNFRVSTTAGIMYIEVLEDDAPVQVYDVAGRAVIRQRLNRGTYEYPLQRGVYITGGRKWCVR